MGWKKCPKPSIGRCAPSRAVRAFSPISFLPRSSSSSSAAAPPSPTGSTFSGSARSATRASSGRPGAWSGEPSRPSQCSRFSSSSAHFSRSGTATPPICPRPTRSFSPAGPLELPVAKALHIVAIIAALLIAVATGLAMESQWPTLALYWYAPHTATTVTDPIFGRPLGFYLFTLPAWQLIAGWLLTLAVIVCVLAVLFLLVAGGGRALDGRFAAASLPWRGVSIAAGFLLLTLAIHEYVGRFQLLFEHHTIFDGVTYTDAHVTLIGMLFVSAALALGAAIAFVGGILRPRGRWLLMAIAPAAVCFVVAGMAGWYVTTFRRQAQPARPRAALYCRQHRLHPPGLRPRPLCAERVSRRDHGRRRRSGTQSGHAREHSPVGRGRAAGHAAPGAGDPHLLRLSRHRHRSLPDQRLAAPGDAGRARAERGQAAREQPQLDQRQAHLHPRLRHHHESRERIHARRPAHALPEQHARAKHRARTQRDAARDLFRRDDQHRRLCEDASAGVQLSRGAEQQSLLLRGHAAAL